MANKDWITLDEAIKLLNEAHNFDAKRFGRDVYSKKTLYNAISDKRIQRSGPRHAALVSARDIMTQFGPKKSA